MHWRAVLRAIPSHVNAGAGGRLIGPLPGTAELWHLASGTVTAVGLDSVGHGSRGAAARQPGGCEQSGRGPGGAGMDNRDSH